MTAEAKSDDVEKPYVRLQNPSSYNAKNGTNYDFVFVIDTCENLSAFTKTKCKTEQESQAALNTMIV